MLSFNADNHEYKWEDRRVFSVTQVLQSVGISDFSMVKKEVLERAQDYGTKVHKMLELYNKKDLNEEALDLHLVKVLDQWKQFQLFYNIDIHAVEEKLYSKKYKFAGTLDLIFSFNGIGEKNRPKKLCVIDCKTGAYQKSHPIQTSAYVQLLLENMDKFFDISREAYTLTLTDNSYKLNVHRNRNNLNVFLSALQVANYKGV